METEVLLIGSQRIEEYVTSLKQEDAQVKPNDDEKIGETRGEIEFRNVFFRYREGHNMVLRDLSFRVRPGQKVGVVGRTGAGKSSIL